MFRSGFDFNDINTNKIFADCDAGMKIDTDMNIFEAVNAENCDQIQLCFGQINDINEVGDSPLIVAVQKRHLKAMKILLELGADKEAVNKAGQTPLLLGVMQGRIDIVTLLLDYGANINSVDKSETGCTVLFPAAWENQLEMAELLLHRGACVNATSKVGYTPLNEATFFGHEDMVKLLLQHGADPNHSANGFDVSALYCASDRGHHDIAKILLDAGANVFHKLTNNTVLSAASDDNMKQLISQYQRAGGPSWLMRELCARHFKWSVVCDTLDLLLSDFLDSRESLARIPRAKFTDAYLQDIGIDTLTVRCALLEMRAQATWLGARLASQGVSVANMLLWENLVCDMFGCSTEASFAALPETSLQDCVLAPYHTSAAVRDRLRVVHQQVCEEHQTSIATPAAAVHHPPLPTSPVPSLASTNVSQCAHNTEPDAARSEAEDRVMRDTVVKVENASMSEVNGNYHFSHMRSNTCVFVRVVRCGDEEIRYVVRRMQMHADQYAWVISNPTRSFYYTPCGADEEVPVTLNPWFHFSTHAYELTLSVTVTPPYWEVPLVPDIYSPPPPVVSFPPAVSLYGTQRAVALDLLRREHTSLFFPPPLAFPPLPVSLPTVPVPTVPVPAAVHKGFNPIYDSWSSASDSSENWEHESFVDCLASPTAEPGTVPPVLLDNAKVKTIDAVSTTKSKGSWADKSRAFREAVKAAKNSTAASLDSSLLLCTTVPVSIDSRLILCDTCGRTFSQMAGERHILKCSKIIAKPTTLMRGAGGGCAAYRK